MNISIVMSQAEDMKKYLKENLTGNEVFAFTSVQQLYEYVTSSAIRTQLLIIHDNGINNNGMEEGFDLLHKILYKQSYFSYTKLIFLNLTSNQSNLSRYDYIKTDEKMRAQVEVYTQDTFKPSFVANICKNVNNNKYEKVELGDTAVIQTKRSETAIVRADMADTTIHPTTEFKSYIPKTDISIIEKRFEGDNSKIETKVSTKIDNITTNPPNIPVTQATNNLPKIISVLGSKNSGVSSTVLALGHTAAQNGKKVLIVDLDTISLGLSYLADAMNARNIFKEPIETYKLADIKGKGNINDLELFTSRANNLHCLQLTLNLIKSTDDITFIISSIVSKIKGQYDHIILDIPISLYDDYYPFIEYFVDGMLITFTPFIYKAINTINEVKQSSIVKSRHFKENKIVLFNCGITNNNNIPLMRKSEMETYVEGILNKSFPITNIFDLQKGYYCDMFDTIIQTLAKGGI